MGDYTVAINQWAIQSPLTSPVADYLRGEGYACDAFGLLVDEMIEAGWIKLSEI